MPLTVKPPAPLSTLATALLALKVNVVVAVSWAFPVSFSSPPVICAPNWWVSVPVTLLVMTTSAVPAFKSALSTTLPVVLFPDLIESLADSVMAPLLVPMAAATVMFCPAWALKLLPTAVKVTGLLIVMSFFACSTMSAFAATSVAGAIVWVVFGFVLTVLTSPIVARPPVATVMFSGSSSHRPADDPADAPASTLPLRTTRFDLPEVSTRPPLPPSKPPRAEMLPSNTVTPSAQTTTLPPSPSRTALAFSVAPDDTQFTSALRSGPWPCQLPPTSTLPPPTSPDASSRALLSSQTREPSTLISPPCSPVAPPLASTVPATRVTPSLPPSMTIRPSRRPIERACTTPSRLSTVSATPARAAALNSMLPPLACRVPSWLSRATRLPSLRALKKIRPSPSRSS